jgi:uncharacterized protein (DUF1501 family)
MKRRTFVKNVGITVAGMPIVLNNIKYQPIQKKLFNYSKSAEDRVLVIIRLNGGNDGLSTVIPLDQYDNLVIQRQNVLIPENQLLDLNQHNIAFHPEMTGMYNMFQDGQLGIIQNVGYPEQNRSHFRSMDIWSTGKLDPYEHSGWLGRYFDEKYANYPDDYPNNDYPDPFAISMGYSVSETCQGLMANFSHAVSNPFDAYNLAQNQGVDDGTYYGSHMAYLNNLIVQSNKYGSRINTAANAGNTLSTLYDSNNPIAVQLRYVAQMISGGLKTKVYILNLDGFDTHNAQVSATSVNQGRHADLLRTLSNALVAFQDDLNLLGLAERVAGFTFSEFGRQIASNASKGTDHGDAAPMFLFGQCISSQVIGPNPVVSDTVVNQAAVPMQIDFRNVYASLLKDWFMVAESDIEPLFEHTVEYIDLLGACNVGIDNVAKNKDGLTLFPNPASDKTNLQFEAKGESYTLQIIDMNGRTVIEPFSGKKLQGEQIIPIELHDLKAGFYTVRLYSEKGIKAVKLIVGK